MSKLVTIYGGSGFAGRYIAQRMAKAGWRVRVAVRRPNEALYVRPYGVVGQVEPILCNIRDDASVRAALQGADAVVNCVGILNNCARNKFDAVHHEGAERIARIAATEGVNQMVHLSAIGADKTSDSDYARTKGLGEESVMTYFPGATILRPSVMFGIEDQFFNKFASMTKFSMVLPIVGGNSKFQPVFVDDVAAAVESVLTTDVRSGVYELGGPEVKTLKELAQYTVDTIQRRRLVWNMPFFMGRIMGFGFDMMQKLSLGLVSNTILTRDQVRQLHNDNVVATEALGLADLGISPTPYEAVTPDYLWRFRPSGEFASIKASAKKLRNT